ncbi:Dehydrogenase (flavoprotein) [Chitinophaga costaii]|uniref:Dehydrogenase (Flavoprotein) n=1 Tax=Chitinophaga costaii TaxID=1335309 RepID=A0A1C4E1C0_9BACT|nr:FAD-dependent monooxygenase [Chitinophaga costaii]PUZ24380.1 FAD-binding protein [Chitinophaga costaii]SCC37301.1 Dehydrogenase (flavoprotein) [Chitinophaga costaii]
MKAISSTYDVIIIGGGLAGLALAIRLGQTAVKVLVIEKEDYPRHKVCGEYISLESQPFLESLGLPLSQMALPAIRQLQVTDVQGRIVAAPLHPGGFGISRYTLDAALAQLAVESGCTLLTHTRADEVISERDQCTVTAGGKVYTARVACGTWGKRSNLDVKWQRPFIRTPRKPLNNYVGIKYHIRYPWPPSLIALHNFKDGYGGISAIEDGKCCLCYLTRASQLQKAGSIRQMEQDILFQNPALKKIFQEAEFLWEQPVTISQISFQQKEQVYDHVLLLGDAAGLIAPLCGNGMSMAFHAAKLAAGIIPAFLSGHITRAQMETQYQQLWKRQFSRRLSVGRLLQGNFGRNKITSLFLRSMQLLPFLKKALIKNTFGPTF